jgi:hypothetical protein
MKASRSAGVLPCYSGIRATHRVRRVRAVGYARTDTTEINGSWILNGEYREDRSDD